ncbi:hypothetical protein [Nesterenkonia sp. PF2B19]|uniref:hypothetical protein n=1 Tax=Nesterenkonia sp. PF2B19 TaxID=1881858 RepID=UPI0008733A1A|nr:hypothetical protein [Nesterenkonia sp. PF2B19]OSM43496.1 hypothetical protein BCY76_008230 [Nesterenkonia sp. PF2B19]
MCCDTPIDTTPTLTSGDTEIKAALWSVMQASQRYGAQMTPTRLDAANRAAVDLLAVIAAHQEE